MLGISDLLLTYKTLRLVCFIFYKNGSWPKAKWELYVQNLIHMFFCTGYYCGLQNCIINNFKKSTMVIEFKD